LKEMNLEVDHSHVKATGGPCFGLETKAIIEVEKEKGNGRGTELPGKDHRRPIKEKLSVYYHNKNRFSKKKKGEMRGNELVRGIRGGESKEKVFFQRQFFPSTLEGEDLEI